MAAILVVVVEAAEMAQADPRQAAKMDQAEARGAVAHKVEHSYGIQTCNTNAI